MAKTIYDIIKKQNGEGFARVLRDRGLLDIPNIANIVKYAGHSADDATALFSYLWSLKEFDEKRDATVADPFELLDRAGYHAFEVHNLDEQNSIKRFFRDNEQLCTFRDPFRYETNYMIHAIRHEVWRDPYAIAPSENPQRQDAYGTSVISIQISKTGGFISIKNRYNHTVQHPDQTFHSNPDEIIPGLSAALKGYFHIDWQQTGVPIPNGFVWMSNHILKVNFEVNNCYFGDDFYTTRFGGIIDIDKRQEVQMDYFIWDNQKQKLRNPSCALDDFVSLFNNFVCGKKVTVSGKAPNQTILVNGAEVIKLKNRQIIYLNMPGITKIGNNFMHANTALKELHLLDIQSVGNNFLAGNIALTELSTSSLSLESVGDYFLYSNTILNKIYSSNLQSVGNSFLYSNTTLTELYLPNLKSVGDGFLNNNTQLQQILLPNLEHTGNFFLQRNTALSELSLPKLKSVGCDFLIDNKTLKKLNLPNLQSIKSGFLYGNTALTHLDLQHLPDTTNIILSKNIRSLLSQRINDNSRSKKKSFKIATNNLPSHSKDNSLNCPENTR